MGKLVSHLTVNQNVPGSNPGPGEKMKRISGPIQFVKILLNTWKLKEEDAIFLLGFEEKDKNYVFDLLNGYETIRGRDIKERIGCLFRIRKTLSALWRDEEVENKWLRESQPDLFGRTLLELLFEGSMENLLLVKEFVEKIANR